MKGSLVRWAALVSAGVAVSAVCFASQAPGPPGRGNPPTPPTQAAIERAAEILVQVRKALGGDKLAGVKTLIATGRSQRVRGNNLVPIEFEIAIELPDKYVRKDEVPAEESDPTSTGFAGSELIQVPLVVGPPAAGRAGGPPPPTAAQIEAQRAARLATAKQDFVRLALGIFAASLNTYPVSFSFAAKAAAPQGTADVINVSGEGNVAMRLFISEETHLPLLVSWQAPPASVVITAPGQTAQSVAAGAVVVAGPAAPAATASQEEKDQYAKTIADLRRKAQTTPVEYRLYYADYRDVDGLLLPFRLRRAIGADTTEETTFDRWRVNTKIDPRKFAVAK